jgi:hypothetical protein
MYKFYIAVIVGLLSSTTYADTSSINSGSGMGILENNWIRAGVNKNSGTFGSGGGASPGLLFDPTGTGTFNAGFDYLTPGSPFDGFALKVDGVNVSNNNTGTTSFIDPDGLTDGANNLTWSGDKLFGSSSWNITNTFTLGTATPYIDVTTAITAGSAASSVWFGKYIDPDSQGVPGDSSSTDNVLGYGSIPSSYVAFSEATVSRYALGLYSTNLNVDAGIASWTEEADGYTTSVYGDNYGNGDDTIGLSWNWVGVTAGDILTANYAYIFGPSAFDAAYDAVVGGAGGGIDVTGGAGVTDVGSATDSASGVPSGPTIVGSASSSITTHSSSIAEGIQTIERSTSTSTWDIYSDASLGTPVVVLTNPGNFTERMDQGVNIENSINVHTLGFANGVTAGRINSDMSHGTTAETNRYSLGVATITEQGMLLSAGLNKLSTESTNGSMNTTHVGISINKPLQYATIRGNLNSANKDIAYSRAIGSFTNTGTYSTVDRWISVEVETNTNTIHPVVGVTVGNRSTDAWAELGSIQSSISHPAIDDNYNYATLGLNIDLDIGTAHISRTTEATTNLGIGIGHTIKDNIAITANINRSINKEIATTDINAGISLTF